MSISSIRSSINKSKIKQLFLFLFLGLASIFVVSPSHAKNIDLLTGSASYKFPIKIPAGTNGVAPNLSINYNSSIGESWIGQGWVISGLGSIERKGSGYTLTPSYDNTDTFILSLKTSAKLVSSTDVEGCCFYHTQKESFLRIEYLASSDYWLVTDKSGVKYYFGQTSNARQTYNSTNTISWKLDKVLDTHGVYWTVIYDNDELGKDIYPKQIIYSQGAGLACTSQNITSCRTIDFELQERPAGFTATSYSSGKEIVYDKLLDNIHIRLGGEIIRSYDLWYKIEGNAPDSSYVDPRSRGARRVTPAINLHKIVDVGADAVRESYGLTKPVYTFNYNKDPNNSHDNVEANEFSLTIMNPGPTAGLGGPLYKPATDSNCTFAIDMNGDMLPDILTGTDTDWYYYPNKATAYGAPAGQGFGNKVTIIQPPTALPSLCSISSTFKRHTVTIIEDHFTVTEFSASSERHHHNVTITKEIISLSGNTMVVDINGDGQPDILSGKPLLPAGSGIEWSWWKGLPGGQFANKSLIDTNLSVSLDSFSLSNKDVRLADMDSDGLPDIVRFYSVSGDCVYAPSEWRVEIFKNLGEQNGQLRFDDNPVPVFPNIQVHVDDTDYLDLEQFCTVEGIPAPPTKSSTFAFIDMNSDGLLDFVWFARATIGLYSNIWYRPNMGVQGGKWQFGNKKKLNNKKIRVGSDVRNENIRWTDMNADGRLDLFVGGADDYRYFSQNRAADGTASFEHVYLSNGPPIAISTSSYTTLVDMNGDGFTDILSGRPGSYGAPGVYQYYTLDYRKSHFNLTSVENPLRGSINYQYRRFRSGNTIRWVVDRIQLDPQNGLVEETNYIYGIGRYFPYPINEFRGYDKTYAIDSEGYSTRTLHYQDDARAGIVKQISVSSKQYNGKLISYVDNKWSVHDLDVPIEGVTWAAQDSRDLISMDNNYGKKKVTTTFDEYDSYGNVIQMTKSGFRTLPQITSTNYVYNQDAYIVNRRSHQVVSNGNGKTLSESWFDYDMQGNMVTPTKGDLTKITKYLNTGVNPVIQYYYDSFGNRTSEIDAKRNACRYTGYTNHTVFDGVYATYPINSTNAQCHSISNTYWSINTNLIADNSIYSTYSVPGLMATSIDANNVTTEYYWDIHSRPVSFAKYPDTYLSPTKQWTYSLATSEYIEFPFPSYTIEQVKKSESDPEIMVSYSYVDGMGRSILTKRDKKEDNQWVTQYSDYNARGLLESVSLPFFSNSQNYIQYYNKPEVTTLYDARRRPTLTYNTDGSYTEKVYDLWAVSDIDENRNTTTRDYDAFARLISIQEPVDGGLTKITYDDFDINNNNIIETTDDMGNIMSTVLDTLGRVVEQHDPDRGSWYYTYDVNNNRLSVKDAQNSSRYFSYDRLNRLSNSRDAGGRQGEYYYYDSTTLGDHGKGRLRVVIDQSGSTQYKYDSRGNAKKIIKAIGSSIYETEYTYDNLGNVITMGYPDGEILQYQTNGLGQLQQIHSDTYNINYVAAMKYDALGRIKTMVSPGSITRYGYYDLEGFGSLNFKLRNIFTQPFNRAEPLQDITYTYYDDGNTKSITNNIDGSGQSFKYDSLNRLKSAVSDLSPVYSYYYNSIGNMLDGENKIFTYPAAKSARPHAPTSDGTCNFSYNNVGNLLHKACGSSNRYFYWDGQHRLIKIQDGRTIIGRYFYDYRGNRVKKIDGTKTTLAPFEHYRTVNGEITKYYYANGKRFAEGDSVGNALYYHTDKLGSSNIVSDSSGNEVYNSSFYPFGKIRQEAGSEVIAHKYTGQEQDRNTGLYNYGARFYDPDLMHFISADSIVPDMSNPQSYNRYAYVANNPLRYVDPTGYEHEEVDFTYSTAASIFGNYSDYDSVSYPLSTSFLYDGDAGSNAGIFSSINIISIGNHVEIDLRFETEFSINPFKYLKGDLLGKNADVTVNTNGEISGALSINGVGSKVSNNGARSINLGLANMSKGLGNSQMIEVTNGVIGLGVGSDSNSNLVLKGTISTPVVSQSGTATIILSPQAQTYVAHPFFAPSLLGVPISY